MSPPTSPLRTARLVTLILAWCFAIIAGSLGLNSLVKSNQEKSRLKKLAPSPAVVTIDTSDIFNVGTAATTASLLIALLTFIYLVIMLVPSTKCFSVKTLRAQAIILFFALCFLLACMIPYTDFFVNHHAIVTASINGVQLPQSIISSAEQASGSTSIYKHIHYLKLFAILPWFAILFTFIAVLVLFKAGADVAKGVKPIVEVAEKDNPTHDDNDNDKSSTV